MLSSQNKFSKKNKILVLGIKGMAGHFIFNYFNSLSEYDVFGVARNINSDKFIFNLDVNDLESLNSLIIDNNFDIVINCIGVLNKDAEDNHSKAVWFNSYFPHYLESVTKNIKTKLIHISTDCVFSGKKGDYNENDYKDGYSFYAQSKALGEVINEKDTTIRTSIIGPELNPNGIGLFNWFLNKPIDSILNGYSNVYWTGLTTLELSKVIYSIIQNNIYGIIHIAPKYKISKYELLKLFNLVYRNNKMSIVKDEKIHNDKSLVSFRKDFNYVIPDYEQMLIEQKYWIIEHQNLYKHFFSNIS